LTDYSKGHLSDKQPTKQSVYLLFAQ